MGCSSSSDHIPTERFRPRAKPCRSGYMLYSDGSAKWTKVFAVLFEDSMLAWFKKPKEKQPICHVTLRNVSNMLVVGPVCKRITGCPSNIPKNMSYSFMLAFPQWVQPGATGVSSPVFFFLCPNGNAMGEWMSSIAKTLPAPPPPDSVNAAYPPIQGPPVGFVQAPPQPQVVIERRKRKSHKDHSRGFLAGSSLGYGYGHPWGYGWGWGWGYDPCYGWGYDDYDSDCDVDVHVDIDVHYHGMGSVSDFGGSHFEDYCDHHDNEGDFGFDYGEHEHDHYEGGGYGDHQDHAGEHFGGGGGEYMGEEHTGGDDHGFVEGEDHGGGDFGGDFGGGNDGGGGDFGGGDFGGGDDGGGDFGGGDFGGDFGGGDVGGGDFGGGDFGGDFGGGDDGGGDFGGGDFGGGDDGGGDFGGGDDGGGDF